MKIALWQTQPIHEADRALLELARICGRASAAGANIILTPEMMLGGYNIGPSAVHALANQAVFFIDKVREIAKKFHIAIAVGMAVPNIKKPFNAVVLIDQGGHEIGRYHKTHLYGETDAKQFSAGLSLAPLVQLHGWKIGFAICYDIEFPEVARSLALQGADLILVPTANMEPYGTIPSRIVPARAEENGLFLAYANYVGAEEPYKYCGLSCVCDRSGNDLARASGTTSDLVFADLDNSGFPEQNHLRDRRMDLYTLSKSSAPK